MNQFMTEQWPTFEGTLGMRAQLIDMLSDADLTFSPGGLNMTLGALCREMGEVDHSYIESVKELKQDWSYRNTEAGLETSVSKLKNWYRALEADLKATMSALSDEDLKKTIDRGSFSPSINIQLQIYLQALLIFFGKATIYIKAMNRPLPQIFTEWIG